MDERVEIVYLARLEIKPSDWTSKSVKQKADFDASSTYYINLFWAKGLAHLC